MTKEQIEKQKIRDQIREKIQKDYGKGVISRLSKEDVDEKIEVIHSGSLGLDCALGVGGYPRGRVVEVYGLQSSGKSLMTYIAAAEVQRGGEAVALVDAEFAFIPAWGQQHGMRFDNGLFDHIQPDHGEMALDIVESLVRSSSYGLIIIDSVSGLVPREELEGAMGDQQMALQARLMGKALRKLTAVISKTNTTVIFINQVRDAGFGGWGAKTDTSGGRALKFFASVRIEVKAIGGTQVKGSGGTITGHQVMCIVTKNKVGPPKRECNFNITFTNGIDQEEEMFRLGLQCGILEKTKKDKENEEEAKAKEAKDKKEGIVLTMGEKKSLKLPKNCLYKGQVIENVIQTLKEDLVLRGELDHWIREKMK